MALGRGKPREAGSGKHEYTREQSLMYWQRVWKAQIDAQSPVTRRETIQRASRLLRETRYRSALHDLAVCYGLTRGGDGDGDCMDK
jgi:hypothetical protein